jgi:tetratricopeptide (TPR) repeat protein
MRATAILSLVLVLSLSFCTNKLPEGAFYISENDTSYSEDIRSISKKINSNPNDPKNYYLRGNAFYFLDRFNDAARDYKMAATLDSKNPLYSFKVAESLLAPDTANFSEAKTYLEKTIQLKPNYSEAIFLKTKIDLARQQYTDLEKSIKPLLKDPEFKEKAMILMLLSQKEQGDTLAAVTTADRILAEFPNSFDATMQKALFLLEKDPDLSEKYVDKAIVINEFSDEALYTKGLLLQRKQQFKDAIKYYDKVIKINSFHVYSYYNKAVIEALFENYSAAIALCDKIITLNPMDAKTFVLKGVCAEGIGNKKAAKEYYLTALKIDPNYPLDPDQLKLIK